MANGVTEQNVPEADGDLTDVTASGSPLPASVDATGDLSRLFTGADSRDEYVVDVESAPWFVIRTRTIGIGPQ